METNDEKIWWEHFRKALADAEIAASTCIRLTGPFTIETKAKTVAMRAKLLREVWSTVAAISLGLLPINDRSVNDEQLKKVAEELLETIKR